jgi:LysM repeat protein
MRARLIIIASVGLNVGLAAWLLFPKSPPPGPRTVALRETPVTNTAKSLRVVVRKQFFAWPELESRDYTVYITNLRGIGCPEQTIRDIIIADVNQLFARRRMLELVTSDQQWWRSTPDPTLAQETVGKLRALESERRALLTTLLGPNWDQNSLNTLPHNGVHLDGPILGDLDPEVKQKVLDIGDTGAKRTQDYLAAQKAAGRDPDPAELARLRAQTRDELAQVLNASQLEEYLLRYSDTAASLRRDLAGFDVSPDEFRRLFHALDPLAGQLSYASGGDSGSLQQRAALEKQMSDAIRTALGPDRYQQYLITQDPAYRDAVEAAQQAGASLNIVTNLYALNLASAQELDRIRNDPTLSDDEKAAQMQAAEDQQLAARDQLLGLSEPAANPTASPSTPTPPPIMGTHAYSPGETLDQLATQYGTSVSAIQAANPNLNFNQLQRGVPINIPGPKTSQ